MSDVNGPFHVGVHDKDGFVSSVVVYVGTTSSHVGAKGEQHYSVPIEAVTDVGDIVAGRLIVVGREDRAARAKQIIATLKGETVPSTSDRIAFEWRRENDSVLLLATRADPSGKPTGARFTATPADVSSLGSNGDIPAAWGDGLLHPTLAAGSMVPLSSSAASGGSSAGPLLVAAAYPDSSYPGAGAGAGHGSLASYGAAAAAADGQEAPALDWRSFNPYNAGSSVHALQRKSGEALAGAQAATAGLVARLQDACGAVARLTQQLAQARSDTSSAQSQTSALRSELVQASLDMATARSDTSARVVAFVNRKKKEIASLQAELGMARSGQEASHRTAQQLRAQVQQLQDELAWYRQGQGQDAAPSAGSAKEQASGKAGGKASVRGRKGKGGPSAEDGTAATAGASSSSSAVTRPRHVIHDDEDEDILLGSSGAAGAGAGAGAGGPGAGDVDEDTPLNPRAAGAVDNEDVDSMQEGREGDMLDEDWDGGEDHGYADEDGVGYGWPTEGAGPGGGAGVAGSGGGYSSGQGHGYGTGQWEDEEVLSAMASQTAAGRWPAHGGAGAAGGGPGAAAGARASRNASGSGARGGLAGGVFSIPSGTGRAEVHAADRAAAARLAASVLGRGGQAAAGSRGRSGDGQVRAPGAPMDDDSNPL